VQLLEKWFSVPRLRRGSATTESKGHCCVASDRPAQDSGAADVCSDGSAEFAERVRDAPMCARPNSEFVVASPDVLHPRMTVPDRSRRVIASAHGAEPGFQPAVGRLDPIVRVLLGVVQHARHEFIDPSPSRPGPVGHDLDRLAVRAKRRREEPRRGLRVPPGRDEHIDDLAVLVDRSVEVTPPAPTVT
jgi:hypothetical protein